MSFQTQPGVVHVVISRHRLKQPSYGYLIVIMESSDGCSEVKIPFMFHPSPISFFGWSSLWRFFTSFLRVQRGGVGWELGRCYVANLDTSVRRIVREVGRFMVRR